MSIVVSKIQRMCFDDGPGIRTTVFLKGCSITCPWCSNPENLKFEKQYYYDKNRCKRNGNSCSYNENCTILSNEQIVSTNCPLHAIGCYGEEYLASELAFELLRDRTFWGKNGGVTFSGGEALMQTTELVEVWRLLKEKGVHLTVETALFVPLEAVKEAFKYIDLFYVDIKILEPQMCRHILGGDIKIYMRNLEYLIQNHANLIFRIPCSIEYVLQKENWSLICAFFEKYNQYKVELFGIHDFGRKKYDTLGMEYQNFEKISEEDLNVYAKELRDKGCEVCIIQI